MELYTKDEDKSWKHTVRHSDLGGVFAASASLPDIHCNCISFDGCVGVGAEYDPAGNSGREFSEILTSQSGAIGSPLLINETGVFQFKTKVIVNDKMVRHYDVRVFAFFFSIGNQQWLAIWFFRKKESVIEINQKGKYIFPVYQPMRNQM